MVIPSVGPYLVHDGLSRMVLARFRSCGRAELIRNAFGGDLTVRRIAMMLGVPAITTLTGAAATVSAIRAGRREKLGVRPLQEYHAGITTGSRSRA